MMMRCKLLLVLLAGLVAAATLSYAAPAAAQMDADVRVPDTRGEPRDAPRREREELPPAQPPEITLDDTGKPSSAFALRIGPYRPDNLMPAEAPVVYADVFGTTPATMFNLDFEWQPVRVRYLGTLAVGASIGYAQKRGTALREDNGDLSPSSERETLQVVPASVDLTYRMNLFDNQVLVPYGGAGVDYWYFINSTEVGDRSTRGAKTGWHWRAGGQLLLDVFEPRAAGNLYRSWGIHNTYLFGEYRISRVSDFGEPGFDLSDRTWFAGLMIEI